MRSLRWPFAGRALQLMKVAAALVLFLFPFTVPGRAQSALDGFDPNVNGTVRVVVIQPDGKILIGGDFTMVAAITRNHIARLHPDGRLDTTFDPNATGSRVDSIAIQENGQILIGGLFSALSPNGGAAVTRNNIARVNSNGTLDSAFNPDANGSVYAVAVQADGKVLAGGLFTTIGGQARNFMARLDSTTGLADTFDPNAEDYVGVIKVQMDGKILVGGAFDNIGGEIRRCMARLDPASGLADSFDPNASSTVTSIAVQADGKVLAAGLFFNIGGQLRNRIARLDQTTGAADSFNPMANNTVFSIVVQPDGMILVGGSFDVIGPTDVTDGKFGEFRNAIARIDPVTANADSFDPNASDPVFAIAVQQDGKVLAGGMFKALAPNGGAAVARNRIARLEPNGRLDQTLNLNSAPKEMIYIAATAVQPDGKILIGGHFTAIAGVPRNFLARVNADGTIDPAFDPSPSYQVYAIAVQADGKILVGGLFQTIGGQARRNLVRLDGTTGLPDSFAPNPNEQVNAITVQADGKILVGGRFTTIGGATRHRMARLDPDTGLADSFDPSPNGEVYGVLSIALQADGKILAGGEFFGENSIGGQDRNGIARLEASSGLADSFNPNANSRVYAIVVRPDGNILVGGGFTSVGGQTRHSIARLDPKMGLADMFDAQVENESGTAFVETLALQVDGKVLAGGNFDHMSGQRRDCIARLDGTSGLSDSFNPNAKSDIEVLSIAIQADGKILVGGTFSGPGSMGGQERDAFARLSNDTAALQNLAVAQSTVTWTRSGSSPSLTRATFEYSEDNSKYTLLGNATESGNQWSLTGLNLPTGVNIYIRARGYYPGGNLNGSQSITESVRNVFLGESPTPTPPTASPTPSPTPGTAPTVLGNISTRLRVEIGDNALIGGFIVTGTQPKKIIMRAIGPSLSPFFPGVLADPFLELRDSSGGLIMSNDNWRTAQEAEIKATGIPPSDDLESAIVQTLPANGSAYTVVVRGANEGTGIAVVEAYDLDQTVDSKLANISTRGLVQAGDDAMIAGTIVLGQAAQRVLVRAIGPSLPVDEKLADPTLELRDGNGTVIRANDNWRSDQEAEIKATTIPPTNDLESAIIETLPASGAAYTAIVRGMNDATGVALVEIYGLN